MSSTKGVLLLVAVTAAAVLCTALLVTADCEVGPTLRGCGLASSDVYQCYERNTAYDIRVLKKGVKEVNVPSIDPLVVPPITVTQSTGRTLNLTKCVLKGGSKSLLSNFSFAYNAQANQYTIFWNLIVPKFRLRCSYQTSNGFLDGKESSGTFSLNSNNYTSSYEMLTGFLTRCDNKTFIDPLTMKSKYVNSTTFSPKLSNAKLSKSALRPLLIAALEPAQANVNLVYLQTLYGKFPEFSNFTNPGPVNDLPYCIQKERCPS